VLYPQITSSSPGILASLALALVQRDVLVIKEIFLSQACGSLSFGSP